MREPKIVREVRPEIKVVGDIFGSNSILLDGRVFITINYLAPWIDNAGMQSLTNQIVALIKGEDGPACATEGESK